MGPPTTETISPGVKRIRNALIPVRDGVRLAADLYPARSSRWRLLAGRTVERESSSTFCVDPRRPSQASAQGRHLFRLHHPDQVTEARADVSFQATAAHFDLSIGLLVKVNGAPHFTQHWTEVIPRLLL